MDGPGPLSRSVVWEVQRAYYEDEATGVFAEVPHQIVDNPYIAAAYARVVVGFLRDCARGQLDRSEPLYIVELGAGAGRFGHGFLRALVERVDALPLDLPPLVYVMTDLAEGTLDDWAANPALDDERLDFARFDVTADRTLALRRRAVALDRLANPLVVIGNYLFDSVPADAFAANDGGLEECLLSVFRADRTTLEAGWTRRPTDASHYGDPDLDALLERYRTSLSGTVFTIPSATIDCWRRLRELSGDRLLVLTADKAFSTEEALAGREEPELARHGGSFSLMVNFHALRLYAEGQGGEALIGDGRHLAIDVAAFLFGDPPGGHAETRAAYGEAIERFTPDDFYILVEGAERAADKLSIGEVVAILRLSGWDAFTFLGFSDALVERVAEADATIQEDLREALFAVWDRHYVVPGEEDLPFAIGRLLYEMRDYEDALEFFEASIEQYGPHPATEHNIKLCEEMLT